ncbi:MAG TPA: phosphoribosyltransferase [Gemmatimonadaceae bacterium]|nr:phosphoribosyltransferase [Gemmatimonadaceae bacterium]
MQRFVDRHDAGRLLAREVARQLSAWREVPPPVVLALPRGGVPVGAELARALGAPLDVMVVRKLGVPGHEELAMGAIASGGLRVVNADVLARLGIPDSMVDRVEAAERHELQRREAIYRRGRPFPALDGRMAFLVDDGIATGATMEVAVEAARRARASKVLVAVPVAPRPIAEHLAGLADGCICVHVPPDLGGVSEWYDDFRQTSDHEVSELLTAAAHHDGGRIDRVLPTDAR